MGKLVFRVASDWQEVVRLRTEIEKLKQMLLSMDSTQSPNTFKKLNVQLGESTKKMNILISDAAKAGATMENDFKKGIYDGEKAVNSLSEEIIKQKNIIRETQNDVSMLTEKYKKLGKYDPKRQSLSDELNRAKAALGEQKYALGELQSQQALARLSTKALKDEYALFKDESKAVITTNEGVGVSFKKMLATIGGIAMLKQIASNVVSTAGMFQKYESVLTNALNGSSDKAKAHLSDINSFAAKTNFQLDELTDDFIKFVNRGVTPSMDAMKRMGDFTNTVAKPFDQLTEAILDINNPERWKEFGVRVQTEGNKVKLSFRDMTVECDRTIESVMKAVEQFGSMKGVEGSTEAIAKTIEGQMSNLEDTITTALAEIGLANQGLISGSISAVDTIVKNYDIIGKSVLALIEIYGVYRAGLLINTIVEQGSVKSIWAKIIATKAATVAQTAYNKVLAMNPYVAVGMAVVSLGIAVYTLAEHTTYAEKTARSTAESMEKMKNASENLKNKTNELLSVIRDETSTQYKKADAYLNLQNILPEVFKNMDIEKIKLMDKLSLLKEINKASDMREIVGAKTNVVLAQKKYDVLSRRYQESVNAGNMQAAAFDKKRMDEAFIELESAKKVVAEIEDIQSRAIAQKKKNNKSDVVQNKEYWENKKKEAETARNALDVSKKNSEEWNKYTKQIQEAQKQIDKYSSPTKQESAAEKLRKQQEGIRSQNDKISEIERKQAIQRKRRAEDMEMEISQSEIDAMTEGAEKKRMQRELDNRKEIQSLERQKEDMIQAVIQAEKEIFDAQEELKAKENNNYQKKTFDSSKVDTGKISSIWDTIIENTSKKQLDDKIREQEASWNEYLIKFGNYQQKRLAIIEKYDKTIKEAETAGDAAILMKEKANALDDFDNSVKNSTTLMGQLFVDASQKSVNEIQGIIEKAELLMQYLAAIKDEQGNAQIGGKTVSKKDILGLGISDNTLQNLELSTEQVEALRNAIDRLKGELGGKSPFKLFETQVKQATDKIAQGGKKNIVQGISEIGSAVTQFTPAISQFGQDLGTIFGNDDLGNKIAGISDALGGVGQTAMGVGQIMSGDIVGGAMSAVSGISSVVKALDGLFGADYSRYNEMKSQYEALDSVWDTLIDKKKEYIKMSYGDEAYKVGKETETLIKQQTQRYYELLNELRQSGSSIGSSSLGKRIEKRLSKKDWDRISGAVGESVTNAESLLNLSAEQLKEVLADPKLVSVLNTVNGDFVKYIQDIVNGSEKLEDIQNQVKEQLTQVSFDSVFDNFVDTLMDMDSSAKDFANNFERYMQKAMLTTMLGNKYKAELQKWYDAFAAANDNKTGISEEDYKKLQEQWNDIVTDAVKERDKLKELLGWTSESSSQDSTKRGFEAMSQDTGEELNGRFTALQASNEEIKNQSVVQSQALNLLTAKADTILSVNTEVRNIADDTRNLIANSYLELMQISENTSNSAKYLKDIKADMAEVKKNTSKL
ncbi:hypothetical protein [Bacteroides fragilis]|jgi:hypothetical protein|uniref:hypothetical protein n=1 Tax=Bacteroides fragilis TaxID=817 RepID=UPI0021D402D8|nr:hypothetical protein [Bacteroides fragilis]